MIEMLIIHSPSGISQLRRRTPHQSHHTRRINHTPPPLPMLPHAQNRILTPPPHALNINSHRQIPDLLLRANRVGVIGVHDPGIVEHDVNATPGVEMRHRGSDIGFAANVAGEGLDASGEGREDRADFGDGGVEKGGGDVGHEDGGAFAGEEDGSFEADAAGERRGDQI